MSKSCAKCQKTVYPLEELKCLDKHWHKGCFKCHECGMTLNMKTYKGFDKMPYCEAHVPKAKATTVADTPEFKRISENTKIQSNAVYHAEFEKTKGKFTQVTDDPELMRIKQNTKIISNVAYHGDLEKKALMEQKRTENKEGETKNKNGVPPPRSPSSYMEELSSLPTSSHQPSSGGPHQHQNYSSSMSQNVAHNRGSNNYYQEESSQNYPRQYTQQVPPSHNNHHRERDHFNQTQVQQQQQQQHQHQQHHQFQQQQQQPHLNHGTGNPSPYSSRGQPNVIYTSDGGAVNTNNSSRKVGSIADYDPMNNYYGSAEQQRAAQAQQQARMGPGYGHGSGDSYQQSHIQIQKKHHQSSAPTTHGQYSSGIRYRALYDYEAQDVDELSFLEGDLIVDCTPVDEGWLTGTNLRTKQRGMLPANYVQHA